MNYNALALFSGGLDSILATKLIQKQGLRVLALHYYTPFFDKSAELEHWSEIYGVDIQAIDLSLDFIQMLKNIPANGYGSALNPCVDCKILMLKKTKELLAKYNAQFIISGEVVGQRPMSQRKDALNRIKKFAGVEEYLVRPLCAQCLEPTKFELNGVIDRSQLKDIAGRGRTKQLELAKEFALTEIPSPAGGCKLTEKDNAKIFWKLLTLANSSVNDFHLTNHGRQFWYNDNWLIIGRNSQNNENIKALANYDDYLFKLEDYAGPLALARNNSEWDNELLQKAASLVASYSTKAAVQEVVKVGIIHKGEKSVLELKPERNSCFKDASLEDMQEAIYKLRRAGQIQQI